MPTTPASPRGSTKTEAISTRPTPSCQYLGLSDESASFSQVNSEAPRITPGMLPVPPSAVIITTSAERSKPSMSSETKLLVCPSIAPAMPASAPEST